MTQGPVDTGLSVLKFMRYIFKPKSSNIKEETVLKFFLNATTWGKKWPIER